MSNTSYSDSLRYMPRHILLRLIREDRTKKEILLMQDVLLLWRKITRGREQENGAPAT